MSVIVRVISHTTDDFVLQVLRGDKQLLFCYCNRCCGPLTIFFSIVNIYTLANIYMNIYTLSKLNILIERA